jgi:hypothetical protein
MLLEDFAIGHHGSIAETLQSGRILCLDLREHTRGLGLLEPEIGIVVRCFESGSRIGHGHETVSASGTGESKGK